MQYPIKQGNQTQTESPDCNTNNWQAHRRQEIESHCNYQQDTKLIPAETAQLEAWADMDGFPKSWL